jgi:hypothetical protein
MRCGVRSVAASCLREKGSMDNSTVARAILDAGIRELLGTLRLRRLKKINRVYDQGWSVWMTSTQMKEKKDDRRYTEDY